MSLRLVLAGLTFTLAVGCAGSRPALEIPPSEGFPDHSAAEFQARLPTPDTLWNSIEADLSIAYSIPGDRGSLNARIAYRRADSVLIRFRAPLGIEVSRALVTGDSVFVYDRVARKLYYGLRGVAEQMLPIGFWRSDVAAAVFGYEELGDAGWSVTADEASYILTSSDRSRTVIVDPGVWRVVASDTIGPEGTIVDQRRFAEFDRVEGLVIPRRIVTSRPDEDVRASISIRRLVPEPRDLSFDLGLRQDVERIPVY